MPNEVPLPDAPPPGPKEQVYDREIAPLMQRIIEICKREHLGILATFELEADLVCTTTLFIERKQNRAALDLIVHGFTAFAVTKR